MKSTLKLLWLGSAGLAALLGATAVQAEPPGIYYSWRAVNTDVTACLNQAGEALESQNLATVQADETSIAGRSEDSTAVFVCLANPGSTTVMVIVASADDEQALALREALKEAF
ncbi:MAG: hypothetical protein HC929_18740 [Leptolyngbyaceae cyanobacterium SM2_5_2]|nr:hypothetical protein [Leptolyngbyaceae cyanobacterium SM2_5_2]